MVEKIQDELYESFNSFLKFTFELIKQVEQDKEYFKFAVVNMQISLELFLKYYFTRIGKLAGIAKKINGDNVNFKDFSQVLNFFFKSHHWSYGTKKELIYLLELRNAIVHKGNNTDFDNDAANFIIKCIFFMHGTMYSQFGESLLISFRELELKTNKMWVQGVNEFIDDHLQGDRWVCLNCKNYTMVTKEFLEVEHNTPFTDIDELVCLCCFSEIMIGTECILIDCYICYEDSYFINILNPQGDQQYIGCCSECDTSTWVRKCKECEKYYHYFETDDSYFNDFYFCSNECIEIYKENWSL